MYTLFGLGNPGDRYSHTPHNAGIDICTELIREWECAAGYADRAGLFTAHRCPEDIEIVLSGAYMNRSGDALAAWARGEPEVLEKVVLVHDDLDLPFGEMKISAARGSGGHRGVESIKRIFPDREFLRFRLGVAPLDEAGEIRKPRGREAVNSYLLSPYSRAAGQKLLGLVPLVARAARSLAENGVEYTISRYN